MSTCYYGSISFLLFSHKEVSWRFTHHSYVENIYNIYIYIYTYLVVWFMLHCINCVILNKVMQT